ncbi:MAG: DUF853 domain-containing protein [Oscillospiraceae bacterium]|jgi:DNA helicase HerA-like ATPase|nr:DUF853 domain-containing protein [Oscillospiraceae bacterium]
MYLKEESLLWAAKVAGSDPGDKSTRVCMPPRIANRHGLITGATGTGKTVTLKVMAESFSDMGVPVFLADIKGDVSGICLPGESTENVNKRVEKLGVQGFAYTGYPTRFFDVYGKRGIPIRALVSDMGPLLLARLLELTDAQEEVLAVCFKLADDNGWILTDTKDLRALFEYAGSHAKDLQGSYGSIPPQTIASLQRKLVQLDASGGNLFFGEPALDVHDWLQCDANGRGYIHLLHCVELVQNPLLYSTFLLFLLSELYEELPEAGDLDKPKIVFFFDEAHLLFSTANAALIRQVEQVARLIRSKGVGVYFVTQSPGDIPETVLAQLGNKIQHALRAYTPKEQKAVRAAAQSFRPNPAFDTEKTIGALGTGEALVSFLDEDGIPQMVQQTKILPPQSYMGVAEEILVDRLITKDPLYAKYGKTVETQSAYEQLSEAAAAEAKEAEKAAAAAAKEKEKAAAAAQKEKEKAAKEKAKTKAKSSGKSGSSSQAGRVVGNVVNTAAREVTKNVVGSMFGKSVGTSIARGLFGTRKK